MTLRRIWLISLAAACGRSGFDLDDGGGGDRYAARVLADRPLGYWRFDETRTPIARDASGNGHDGTYAAVMLGQPGALAGNANSAVLLVDTGGAGVDMGDRFGFEGNAPFTVELWVNATRADALLVGKVFRDVDAMAYDGWHVYYGSTATALRRARLTIDGPPLPLGEYAYVVATYDGVTATVYVNAVAGSPRVTTAGVVAVPAPFLVGNQYQGQWARHTGLVDELAVYDRALTAAEITARYELARGVAGR
jgi:hypothetical protein